MDESEERRVAFGLGEGRPDAWRALYDAYAVRVWRTVARRIGPHSADVADIVQETFLAAAKSARTFDPERGTLWFWLWGIARIQIALRFRKAERHEQVLQIRARRETENRNGTPPDPLETDELALLVRMTLLELPPDYETLLTAKYLDGETVETIAGREKCTTEAVRSKLARARQAFRDEFTRHAPRSERPAGTRP